MSWLSELRKRAKGGRTDAELAFELITSRLSGRQRMDLWQTLASVQFAVDMANKHVQDPRIDTAKAWVDGALAILESRQ